MSNRLRGFPASYQALYDRIGDLYRELNTGDYDRAEARLRGFDIKVWRTRINCKTRVHLGYKPPWKTAYTPIASKFWLTELLYKYESYKNWS